MIDPPALLRVPILRAPPTNTVPPEPRFRVPAEVSIAPLTVTLCARVLNVPELSVNEERGVVPPTIPPKETKPVPGVKFSVKAPLRVPEKVIGLFVVCKVVLTPSVTAPV